MPKFKVSYETTTKPATYTLPAGAKVEKVSALPFRLETTEGYSTESVRVEKSLISGPSVAYVEIGIDDVWLTKAEVKQLIEALQETIDA